MRQCAGCGVMHPKRELVRVVRTKEGEVSLDLTGKKAGRGVYVCPTLSCLQAARKARRFERSLSCKIPDEVYNAMESELNDA